MKRCRENLGIIIKENDTATAINKKNLALTFFQAPNVVHVALVNARGSTRGRTHRYTPRPRTLSTSNAPEIGQPTGTFACFFLTEKNNGLQRAA